MSLGFGAGSTAADFYNGARLAGEQDVVIASVKYESFPDPF